MTLGPLEYVMVAFEGNRFSGEIITALRDAQEGHHPGNRYAHDQKR